MDRSTKNGISSKVFLTMSFQVLATSQPFDIFKTTHAQNAMLYSNKLFIRSDFDDFAYITDQVSSLYTNDDNIFLVRKDILYYYDSGSLMELVPITETPLHVFLSSKYGAILSFSSKTHFNNILIPAMITHFVEDANNALLYNDSQLFIYQSSLVTINLPNILFVSLVDHSIIVCTTNGIYQYKDTTCIHTTPFSISSMVHSNSEYLILQSESIIQKYDIQSRRINTLALEYTNIASIAYYNNILCIVLPSSINISNLSSDFKITTSVSHPISASSVIAYNNSFVALDTNLIYDFHNLPFFTLHALPHPIFQKSTNTISYNNHTTTMTSQINNLILYHQFLFVVTNEISVYQLKDILHFKSSFPCSIAYAIDAPYLYIGDGTTIHVYDISSGSALLKSLQIPHSQFNVKSSIMAIYHANTIQIYEHGCKKYKLSINMKPSFLHLSFNAQFLAFYTDQLIVLNTANMVQYALNINNINFKWDTTYPAFIINHSLYLIFDNIYKITD